MYCSRCGCFLTLGGTFCSNCGASTATNVPPITTNTEGPAERLFKARLLVGIVWVVLIPVLLINLHPVAAVIGIIASFVFAVGWSLKSVPSRYKLLAVPIGLLLVVGVQWIEATVVEHQKMRVEEENKRIATQNAEAARLKAKQEQEAFDRMTPSQHLAAEEQDLTVNAPDDQVADGLRHLNALQNTALAARGKAVRARYEAEQAEEEKSIQAAQAVEEKRIQAAQAADARKAAAENEKQAEQGRVLMAQTIENSMLEQGFDMDVKAIRTKSYHTEDQVHSRKQTVCLSGGALPRNR